MDRQSVLTAAATFLVTSLLLSLAGAIVEEGLFENSRWAASQPGDDLMEATLPPPLHLRVWLALKTIFAFSVAALFVGVRKPGSDWGDVAVFAALVSLLVLASFGGLALVVSVPAIRWGFWAAFSCTAVGLGSAAMHVALTRLEARVGPTLVDSP